MNRSSHLRTELELKAIDLIGLPHYFYQEDHLPCVQLLNMWLLYTEKDHSVVHRLPWMWMETKCLVNKYVPGTVMVLRVSIYGPQIHHSAHHCRLLCPQRLTLQPSQELLALVGGKTYILGLSSLLHLTEITPNRFV